MSITAALASIFTPSLARVILTSGVMVTSLLELVVEVEVEAG